MLKPFQIRNLHLYPTEENLYDASSDSVTSSSHVDETRCRPSGLIHLTGPEYDGMIRDHPNARLTYTDDDDGDIITVGSSFELEQRLDEPAEAVRAVEPVLSHQIPDTPIHLFDIRRSRSVIELWKDVEQSSARRRYTPDCITQMELTEINASRDPSKDDHSPERRELGTNQPVDLRKQWFDACRPPRLLPKETPELEPQVSVDSNSETTASERSSSTIMSLSAITAEGRRQAEEAGSRFHSFKNIPTTSSKAVPNFILNQQNPWAFPPEAVTETKDSHHTSEGSSGLASENSSRSVQALPSTTQPSQARTEPEPLLSAFEAEMAKLLEDDAKEHTNESTNSNPPPPDSSVHTVDPIPQTWPVNLITGILHTVAGGIENLGSELKLKIPEVERHLANAQRTIPEDVGATMHNALSAVESHIQNLARVIQNASNASGEAAERVRQAELRSTEQVVRGLGDMAHEFEEFGKTLFAAFEAEFGQWNNGNEANASDPTTVQNQHAHPTQSQTASNEDPISSEPIDPNNMEKEALSLNTGISQDSPKKSSETAAVVSPIASYQRPPPPQPAPSLPSQTAGKFVSNNQPQAAGHPKPLFSNWPNRPAFVSSSIPTVIRPSGSIYAANHRQLQPSEPTSTGRPTVSFPESVNTLHPSDSVTSLFMGNIGFQVTERVIEEVFASKGFSAQVHLPIDSSTGKHAGFGYARFQSASSAKAALDTLQGIIIDGHSLNLEYSDSSPIDGLQTQAPANQASLNRRLHHRHSWQPNTPQLREHRSFTASRGDGLPKVLNDNAQSRLSRPFSSHSLVEGDTSQNHPEESPEFAARYPSLLPTFRSQEYPVVVPERSMTLSPNSEIARFPPVSQLDAHLLANQPRSGNRTESGQGLPSSNGAHQLTRVSAERASERPSSYRAHEPRRTASTINQRSREFERNHGSAHALRRRATENISLRHLAHEIASRETRPSSVYEGRTRTLPGSFPVDDAPIPATSDDNGCSDPDTRTAIRRSIIDNCVDTLVNFGYGSHVDGGRQRLSIYAEAADGKLSEAIDMIEEERTAYERYKPNV